VLFACSRRFCFEWIAFGSKLRPAKNHRLFLIASRQLYGSVDALQLGRFDASLRSCQIAHSLTRRRIRFEVLHPAPGTLANSLQTALRRRGIDVLKTGLRLGVDRCSAIRSATGKVSAERRADCTLGNGGRFRFFQHSTPGESRHAGAESGVSD